MDDIEVKEIINGEEVVRKEKQFETPEHFQKRKEEFHVKYLLNTYPPGIHKVDEKNSKIKYIDIFSKAFTKYNKEHKLTVIVDIIHPILQIT